jgi:hypothetical protein
MYQKFSESIGASSLKKAVFQNSEPFGGDISGYSFNLFDRVSINFSG